MSEQKNKLEPKLWVKTYADTLYRFAYLRINDKDAAKDLVQETFLAALRNKDTFKGEISEKNWLFTVLKNKIIDHYRKKASSLITSFETQNENENEFFDDQEHWKSAIGPKDWKIDAHAAHDSKEFLEILHKCMMRLSEILKMVFTMKYLDEKESDEICKELNITSSNYWVILHRSKLQLRGCVEKKWLIK